MAYFTAVLSPHGSGDGSGDGPGLDWRPVDVDLEAGSPDELGDVLRGAVDGSGSPDAPVLAVLEREDEWFAVVRTDGPIDVRVFVSDAVAAAESAYAPLFAELPTAGDRAGATGQDDEDGAGDDDEGGTGAQEPRPEPAVAEDVWAGDPELLADLGCPADVLLRLSGSGVDPAEATVEIGELLGFADVLESLR
ncbi:tRNA adenosine deaminase-associated protein [Kineococcus sp. SYSU DK001]|uniref:tRNA adenosine deaminase-associated protein n=1 Tax=Kineococcus sp. SYSU DK001 TaxID=3383122 RepID=UPI003D7EA6EA